MYKRTLDSKTSIIILIKRPSRTSIHPKFISDRFYPDDGANNLVNILHMSYRLFPPKEHSGNFSLYNITDSNNIYLFIKL